MSPVGMPEWLKLDNFGRVVMEAFPDALGCFHVGSSLEGKTWRDVDVRLMLTDEDFEATVGAFMEPKCLNARWNAFCLAFSALGWDMTGLPIDFQIDQQTEANKAYAGRPRSSLGVAVPSKDAT